jgi:hypothetical protein
MVGVLKNSGYDTRIYICRKRFNVAKKYARHIRRLASASGDHHVYFQTSALVQINEMPSE